MLREIAGDREGRRWFTDDALDLTLWHDATGRITAFQLTHGKPHTEHALTWDARRGFLHQRVLSGEDRAGHHKASPLLDGQVPLDGPALHAAFDARAGDLPGPLRHFVGTRLASYPDPGHLHGTVKAADFQPPWYLRNRHLQTILPNLIRKRPPDLALTRERVELPDGDFVDVDWVGTEGAPTVIVMHGLEGNIESPYVGRMLRAIRDQGWRGALLHFRGCSGEPNRLTRCYHSGDTAHLQHFLELLERRDPGAPRAAIGYSLGGNALLKWLGETGDTALLRTAVAVSVPFELAACAVQMDRGFSRLYQRQLIARMLRNLAVKAERVPGLEVPPRTKVGSFYTFDDRLTAPLNGFQGADDYYARCSSRQFLHGIRLPTLILHASDDPFMTDAVVPEPEELAPSVTLELSPWGGHVGFVHTPFGGKAGWLEERIPGYIQGQFGGSHG
jgi:predicted alpha/beta-fold hydrolase